MRTLWLDLATFQKELGITAITDEGIAEMKSEIEYYKDFNNIDYEKISEYEKRFKHDIIAHIRAFSDICPKAKSFIHLGATSNFINDNVDMIIIKKSIETVSSLLTKLFFTLKDKRGLIISVDNLTNSNKHKEPNRAGSIKT